MYINDFIKECIRDLDEIIDIKKSDLQSYILQEKKIRDEIIKYKLKRGVYSFYLDKKGELLNGSN